MYNSQYYTCEQIDERLLQGYLDDYNTQTGQSLTKAQFLTKLGSLFSKEGVIDNTATQIGYYECDTAAGTAAKAITVANYALFAGGSMKVKFANKNTANNATLNINSQGAKALYYQGERASATNSWDANEVVEIYYDGTSYYANNVKGGSGSGVYDVSKEHPTSGPNSDGKFTLEYILNSSNVNELIPVNKRYPGMTIQFVSTSDNKYVQYRFMLSEFTAAQFTKTANWQGVVNQVAVGSKDLVDSDGIAKETNFFTKVIDVSGGGWIEIPNIEVGQKYKIVVVSNTTANWSIVLYKQQDASSDSITIGSNTSKDAGTYTFYYTAEDAAYKYLRIGNPNGVYSMISTTVAYLITSVKEHITNLEAEVAENTEDIEDLQEAQIIKLDAFNVNRGGYIQLPFTAIGTKYSVSVTTNASGNFGITLNSDQSASNKVQDIAGNADRGVGTFTFYFEITVANANYIRVANTANGTYANISNVTGKKLQTVNASVLDLYNEISEVEEDVTTNAEAIEEINNKLTINFPSAQKNRGGYLELPVKSVGTKYAIDITLREDGNIGITLNSAESGTSAVQTVLAFASKTAGTYRYTFEITAENANFIKVANLANGSITHISKLELFRQIPVDGAILENRVEILENRVDIRKLESYHTRDMHVKEMAERYDTAITKREMYLRQKYHYDGIGKWYGVHWVENDNAHNVTDIYSEGDSALCDALPIQNKMRRCVVKDGAVQYYLHPDNSLYKEDGVTLANLDGTDGNVMVEIPEFFYKAEVSLNGDNERVVDLKISEYGIDGFNYSPKCYCGIGFATLNRDENYLVSVITAIFEINNNQTLYKYGSADENFIVTDTEESGATALSGVTTALRTGFSANAAKYRGGNQEADQPVYDPISGTMVTCDHWDDATDPTDKSFCLNKLGNGISQVQRSECRAQARMEIGETMYLYNVQRALWILSSVEFKTRNIQDAINTSSPREGGLGRGATIYPSYDACMNFFAYQGNTCIPNGVTLCLGNHSGEVYYKMPQVPTTYENNTLGGYKDIYIPVMSYRGVENFYGHLYSCADQIAVTNNAGDSSGRLIDYYYQRNPFLCKTDISEYEHIGQFKFKPTIMTISSVVLGFDGHILPRNTFATQNYNNGYCDCCEIGTQNNNEKLAISYNGRLVSGDLPGRNFMVAEWEDDERANRASESTRLCAFIL